MTTSAVHTWSGRATTDGNTSPGESHNRTFLVRKIVWKCFVWPGVRDTLTTFTATQNPDKKFISKGANKT